MKTVIIKYNAGNTRSVSFALERIGINALITDDVEEIRTADKVILPGVGEASSAMQYLREKKLDTAICSLKQPILGICLGMQLMCNFSEEGKTKCLGIFNQDIKLFGLSELKVPQMGWNTITDLKTNIFNGINENEYQYLVHSYYAEVGNETIAKTNYGINYSSALNKNNFYGVQFHPEKSGPAGQRLLKNFIEL